MSEKSIFRYPGTAVAMHWDKRLCIQVGECTRARNDLFASGRNPWCDPDLTAP